MTGQSTTGALKSATAMSIGGGVMIVLGLLAVFLPSAMGIGVSVVLGWIFVFNGLAYFAYAFAARSDRELLWRMLIGFIYVFGGFYLFLVHWELALESLRLVVAAIVFLGGMLEIVVFYQIRPLLGSGWILFDGIATLLLACLILLPWLSSSTWAIGILVGTKIIVSGFTRLMYSVAARKTLKTGA